MAHPRASVDDDEDLPLAPDPHVPARVAEAVMALYFPASGQWEASVGALLDLGRSACEVTIRDKGTTRASLPLWLRYGTVCLYSTLSNHATRQQNGARRAPSLDLARLPTGPRQLALHRLRAPSAGQPAPWGRLARW